MAQGITRPRQRNPKGDYDPQIPDDWRPSGLIGTIPLLPKPDDKILRRDHKRLPREKQEDTDSDLAGGDVARARHQKLRESVHHAGEGKGEPELRVGRCVGPTADSDGVDEGAGDGAQGLFNDTGELWMRE